MWIKLYITWEGQLWGSRCCAAQRNFYGWHGCWPSSWTGCRSWGSTRGIHSRLPLRGLRQLLCMIERPLSKVSLAGTKVFFNLLFQIFLFMLVSIDILKHYSLLSWNILNKLTKALVEFHLTDCALNRIKTF